MATIIDTIIQSETAPNKTNVLWDDGTAVKRFKNGKWVPIGGFNSEDLEVTTYRPYLAYSNSRDGVADFTTDKNSTNDYDYIGVAVSYNGVLPTNPSDYEWSKMRGKEGPQGVRGPQGPQGIPGPQGVPGGVAVSSLTVMAFKTSKTKPEKPSGGSWNVVTNNITYPNGWSKSDNLQKPIWMSTRTFYSDTAVNSVWSEPTLISAEDGTDGTDGDSTEFMYKRTRYYTEAPPTIPTDQKNWNPKDDLWTDDPTGIDEEMQCEWVINRVKKDGVWGLWKGPTLWSKWGVNGKDGAGVEYIYYRGTNPSNPTPTNWRTNSEYQDTSKEYVPTFLGWSDEPQGVDINNLQEWVCVRKYKTYTDPNTGKTTEEKIWNPFSQPALWASFGERGKDAWILRTYYYISESTTVKPPYDEDNPTSPGTGWTAIFPEDYNEDMIIWALDSYVDVSGAMQGTWKNLRLYAGIKGKLEIPYYYNTTYYAVTSNGNAPNAPLENRFMVGDTIKSTDETGAEVIWTDYPNDSSKQWYEIVGRVNTNTNKIEQWSKISTWNGKDGNTKDGPYWDEWYTILPADIIIFPSELINRENIDPNYGVPLLSDGTKQWKHFNGVEEIKVENSQRMWGIKGKLASDGTSLISGGWSYPYPMTGEKGIQGATGEVGPIGPKGPQGESGINGVSYRELYMIGTEEGPKTAWISANKTNYSPNDWNTGIPKITDSYPYIWCIKARVLDGAFEDPNEGWGEGPFMITGTVGTTGKDGTPSDVGILTNPTDLVIIDASTKKALGLPISTTFRILSNAQEQEVQNFYYEVLDGNGNYLDIDIENTTLNITNIEENCPNTIYIKIGGNKKDSDIDYYQIFTLKTISSLEKPITANLLDDNVVIPCKNNVVLVTKFSNKFELFVGGTSQPLSDLFISTKDGDKFSSTDIWISNPNLSTGEFDLKITENALYVDNKVIYITGQCIYNNTPITKTLPLKLTKVESGDTGLWYTLKVDSTVKLELDGNYTPSTFAPKVLYHEGNITKELTWDEVYEAGLSIVTVVDGASNSEQTVTQNTEYNEFIDLDSSLKVYLKKQDEILDTENTTIVSDGHNSVVYKLVSNIDYILYDETGKRISPEDTIKISILKIDGKNITEITDSNWIYYDRELDIKVYKDGVLLDSIKYPFEVNIDTFNIENILSIDLIDPLQHPDVIIDTKSIVINKRIQGGRGSKGQVIYPAGRYSLSEEYVMTDTSAPYVFYDNAYYLYKGTIPWIGNNQPSQSNTPTKNPTFWEEFEGFEAIYADVGILKQALVGNAVFYGNYIFSQQGTDHNGNPSNSFEKFGTNSSGQNIINNGEIDNLLTRTDMAFYPSICLNFKTGEGWMSNKKFLWDTDGNVTVGGIKTENNITTLGEVWQIDENGNIISIDKKIQFNKDGSGQLGDAISWNKDDGTVITGTLTIKDTVAGSNKTEILANGDQESYTNLEGYSSYRQPVIKVSKGSSELIAYECHSLVKEDVPDEIRNVYILYDDYIEVMTSMGKKTVDLYTTDESGNIYFLERGICDYSQSSTNVFRRIDKKPYVYRHNASGNIYKEEDTVYNETFKVYDTGDVVSRGLKVEGGVFEGDIDAGGNFEGSVYSNEGALNNYTIKNSYIDASTCAIDSNSFKLSTTESSVTTSSVKRHLLTGSESFKNKTNKTKNVTLQKTLCEFNFVLAPNGSVIIPDINYNVFLYQPSKNKKGGPTVSIKLIFTGNTRWEQTYYNYTHPNVKTKSNTYTDIAEFPNGAVAHVDIVRNIGKSYGERVTCEIVMTVEQTVMDREWLIDYAYVSFNVTPTYVEVVDPSDIENTCMYVFKDGIKIQCKDGTIFRADNNGIQIIYNQSYIKIGSGGSSIKGFTINN